MATSNARLLVELVEIGRVFCSPSNPRQNDQAVEAVAASLRRFGFQQPLVAKPSGEVIAGNTRLKAATSLGQLGIRGGRDVHVAPDPTSRRLHRTQRCARQRELMLEILCA